VLHQLPVLDDPNYLNRDQHFADAGIYRISGDRALVQSVDFFTPIVDDPYDFGQIAAANSFSDLYAMGAKPLTALNIICFPVSCYPLEIMEKILKGGYDKVIEAEAVVVGGHSVEDPEPKYGLAVTGLVDPQYIITGSGAVPGEVLVLTKPVGTGIIATAVKGEMISLDEASPAIRGMARLNDAASRAMLETGVSAATDITGFSFLGHLHEMLVAGGVGAEIDHRKVPLYPGVKEMMGMGMIPGGAYRNLEYVRPHVSWSGKEEEKDDALIILADPQTSGGLLVALPENKVRAFLDRLEAEGGEGHVVGRITDQGSGAIRVF